MGRGTEKLTPGSVRENERPADTALPLSPDPRLCSKSSAYINTQEKTGNRPVGGRERGARGGPTARKLWSRFSSRIQALGHLNCLLCPLPPTQTLAPRAEGGRGKVVEGNGISVRERNSFQSHPHPDSHSQMDTQADGLGRTSNSPQKCGKPACRPALSGSTGNLSVGDRI